MAGSFTDEVLAGLSVTVAAATLLVALRVATDWWGAATAGALALEAMEARRCRWCCMVASRLQCWAEAARPRLDGLVLAADNAITRTGQRQGERAQDRLS